MRHPTEGVLRRLVDEPAGVTDDERAHVASCPTCLRGLEAVRAEAQLVSAALAPATTGIDTDAGWARFSATATAPATTAVAARRAVRSTGPARWRTAVRRPAVAGLSAVLLLTGAGVAAANDWLPIFQTERVDTVEVTSTELVQIPDLSAYGDLEITQEPETQEVADAATAS